MDRPKKKKVPLIGYCDICGPAGERRELYALTISTSRLQGQQHLCLQHFMQERRNNSNWESIVKPNYYSKLISVFADIFDVS